jgi:hypothetical protein
MNAKLLIARNVGIACLFCGLVGMAAGMTLAWKMWRTKPVVEVPAPAKVNPDGSVTLAKQPDATAKPAHQVPQGGVVERIVRVVVRPKPVDPIPPINAGSPEEPVVRVDATPCPDVQVDLTLTRMPDGTKRVTASSPNGTVVPGASLDIPVEAAIPTPQELRHALGIRWQKSTDGSQGFGPAYDYDRGFLRASVDVVHVRYTGIPKSDWVFGAALKFRFKVGQ